MKINNTAPVTTSTFDGMWIKHAQIIRRSLPLVQAVLLPYDGTHLLATGERRVTLSSGAQLSPAVLSALDAEIARLTGNNSAFELLQIMAADPSKPVRAQVIWAKTAGSSPAVHVISDCFAKASEDAQFAQVFGLVMADIARLAGCSVQA